jgi:hypothetical protein
MRTITKPKSAAGHRINYSKYLVYLTFQIVLKASITVVDLWMAQPSYIRHTKWIRCILVNPREDLIQWEHGEIIPSRLNHRTVQGLANPKAILSSMDNQHSKKQSFNFHTGWATSLRMRTTLRWSRMADDKSTERMLTKTEWSLRIQYTSHLLWISQSRKCSLRLGK